MVNYVISLLKQVVIFSSLRSYKNLSHIDPAVISTSIGSSSYFHPVGGGTPYVFMSPYSSQFVSSGCAKYYIYWDVTKAVAGALIEGEYKRLVGCISQIICLRDFKSQIFSGIISFTHALSPVNSSMLF